MREDAEILTLEDALACIKWHFTESDGLLVQIEMGKEIDEKQVQMIGTAFQLMQAAWKDKVLVAKNAVQLVRTAIKAIPRLEQYMLLYPQREAEISRFLIKVSGWTDSVFFAPLMPLSEEGAITLVCQHFLGIPSFNTELMLGHIDENALGELSDALERLAQIWETKEYISKLAAHAMLSASWLFEEVANVFSSEKKQRLQEIERQLDERITLCLS